VDENIRFYADLFGVRQKEREQQAQRLLEAAGMAEFRARLAGKLSGGMKQKLGLACALIHRPEVILLDEPTNGVDPVSRRDFWKILYALALEGTAVLISTAYLDEAERCHRVALMNQGKILFCDTPEQLKKRLPGGVVAITSAEPRRVRDVLAGAEGIRSLVMTGDGVHVVADNAERRMPEFRQKLQQAGVAFDEMVASLPTIEDLFVEAVSATGESNGGSKRSEA
jgi:ABC-2 type transport system ATP-binding protein